MRSSGSRTSPASGPTWSRSRCLVASTDPTPRANATLVAVNRATSSNRRDRAGAGPARQRGEHRRRADAVIERVQQHRPGVAAVHPGRTQPRRRPRDGPAQPVAGLDDGRSAAAGSGNL